MVSRAVVVGDCVLDVSVGHGPITPAGDRPARIRLAPGGQGANVAVGLARRGVASRLIAPWYPDAAGRLLRDALEAEGVELRPLPATHSGAVVVLLDATGERTMLSDRVPLAGDPLAAALAAATDCGWLHVSGYVLADDSAADALASDRRPRPADRLSLAGGSLAPAQASVFAARLGRLAPDLLVLARGEAEALVGGPRHSLVALTEALDGMAQTVVVTAAAEGSAARVDGRSLHVGALPLDRPSVDSTGAGDAYAAALIARLLDSRWPPDERVVRAAMEEASLAGARAAAQPGAQPRAEFR